MEVIFPLTFFFDDIKSSGTLIRNKVNPDVCSLIEACQGES